MLRLVFFIDCEIVRPLLKRVGRILAALTLVPLLGYVALLAFNWRDRPPSAAALELERASQSRPEVSDADNAYVYLMGFAVAPGDDPRAAGRARTDWAKQVVAGTTRSPDPLRPVLDLRASRSATVNELSDACEQAGPTCAVALTNGAATLAAWLADERWLLERYESLLAHPAWREPTPFDLQVPLPSYSIVLDAQRLWLFNAWTFAGRGNVDALRAVLSRDIRFWRHTLSSADLLITKMIAVAALRRHFEFANLVLRELPAQSVDAAIPEEWRTEISVAERSMLRSLAGEWTYLDRVVRLAKEGEHATAAESAPLTAKVWRRALNPLLQPQASSNSAAERFLMLARELEVPYENFTAALGGVRAKFREAQRTANTVSAYNASGTLLAFTAPSDYSAYAARVADVEGIRRAALLTATLRADAVEEKDLTSRLAAAMLRDPYDAKPFEWDPHNHAVVFTGLEEGDRRRHAFVY